MAGHDLLHVAAVFVAIGTYILTALFASGVLGHQLGLFSNSTELILAEEYSLEKYEMDVTPADWTFYLSSFIFLWQATWLVYGLTTICRRTEEGYIYVVYPTQPAIMYVVFSFSLACNVSWLLIWDQEYLEVALVFINLMNGTLYICLVVSIRRLNDHGLAMVRQKLRREIWTVRILVQNGLGAFATWGSVAAVYNFAVVLIDNMDAKTDQGVGSTVSLTVFSLEIVAWWVMDNFVLERYLRYLITPYLVILITVCGILSKNWNIGNSNTIYTLVLTVFVAVLFTAKIVLSVYRHWKRPLFSSKPKYRRPVVSFEVRNLLETQH